MPSFGKSLEVAAREIRPYLSPAYRKAFRILLARGLHERLPNEPIVCFDFSESAINAVGGRYYYSLVRDVIDAGYFPVFTAKRVTLSSFATSRMNRFLAKERLGVVKSLADLKEEYLFITDQEGPISPLQTKLVRVNYEHRLCSNPSEIAFPLFAHPQVTSLVKLPYHYPLDAKRSARLFFAGNTEETKYDKNVIRDIYQMKTRREILATVSQPSFRPTDALKWLQSDAFHPYVLCETQHCKIPPELWLDALAKADFFLACPGVSMPLCHNLVEAMAAGTIPILQYANYLPEPLEDEVNCLTFHNTEGLKRVLEHASSMSQKEILSLRHQVRSYYQKFLAPGCLTKRLIAMPQHQITLLLNAYRVPRL